MTAQPMQDMLRGYTLASAREEAERMARRAEEIAVHLARYHYGERNMVGRNLRAEMEACEREAADLEYRIAEVQSRRAL